MNQSHPPRSAATNSSAVNSSAVNSSAVNSSAVNSSATNTTSSFPRQPAAPRVPLATTTPIQTSGDGKWTMENRSSTGQASAPIENQRHRDVFRFWFKHNQSVPATCRKFKIPQSEFEHWSGLWKWEKRTQFIKSQASHRSHMLQATGQQARLQRQKHLGRLRKTKALKGIRYLDPTTLSTAQKIVLARVGTEFENAIDALPPLLLRIANATPDELTEMIKELEFRRQRAIEAGAYTEEDSILLQSLDKP